MSFLSELEELNIYKSPQEEIDYLRGEYNRLSEIEDKWLELTKGFDVDVDYLKRQLEKAERYDQLVEKAAKINASKEAEESWREYHQRRAEIEENTRRRTEWQKQKDERLRELQYQYSEHGTHYEEIQRVRGMVNPY